MLIIVFFFFFYCNPISVLIVHYNTLKCIEYIELNLNELLNSQLKTLCKCLVLHILYTNTYMKSIVMIIVFVDFIYLFIYSTN